MSSSDDEVAGATPPVAERVERPTPPEREKPKAEWTVDDVVAYKRTGQMPDSDDYRAYVRKVHEDAGLEPPASAIAVPEGEPSVDQIFQRKTQR